MADAGFGSHRRSHHFDYDPDQAVARLRRIDPDLRALIKRVGPYALQSRAHLTPFQALLRAIVYQMLSTHAAASIDRRLCGLFPHRYPSPKRLLALSDEELRSVGLSKAKVLSAQDLAEKCLSGVVPNRRVLATMDNELIIKQLSTIRGIGTWTAEMLLIFHLGRADVLPVGDLGIRKGFMLHRGDSQMPKPKDLENFGLRWRPYRSVASWYLWQATYLDWNSDTDLETT